MSGAALRFQGTELIALIVIDFPFASHINGELEVIVHLKVFKHSFRNVEVMQQLRVQVKVL